MNKLNVRHLLCAGIIAAAAVPAWGDGLDFLPPEIHDEIAEVEKARMDWEDRSEQIAEELDIQPYETPDEFQERVARAVRRGAGRQKRYLHFLLGELEQTGRRVQPELVHINPLMTNPDDRSFLLEVTTDLGILPEPDTFELTMPVPNDPQERSILEQIVGRSRIHASIDYTISGNEIGQYTINLTGLRLHSTDSPHATIDPVRLSRQYTFAGNQDITLTTQSGYFTFDDGQIPAAFSTSSEEGWTVTSEQAQSGSYSLRSGQIQGDDQSVVTYSDMVPPRSRLSRVLFHVKTSTENSYDNLEFYVNGQLMDSWSGQVDWTEVEYPVDLPGGQQFDFQWVYSKDGSVNEGEDAVWIDSIQIVYED
ncbi:MAG: hypothetical protein ACOC0D_09435 [Spirochaeta sp.]